MGDPEIDAISAVATALADLDEDTRVRVLRWAGDRYGVASGGQEARSGTRLAGTKPTDAGSDEPNGKGAGGEASRFERFAELFAAANPKTNEDKALLAAYWLQEVQGQSKGWQSATLQKDLKNLGHAIPNITDALTSNMDKKPQRIIQLQKAGNSRQARKTYKVTVAGSAHVQAMLRPVG